MRLCLIGDFSGTPDEGMKNVSRTTYERLSRRHDVMNVNTSDLLKPGVLMSIRRFNPEVVHYLHGPTIRSLVLLRWLTIILGRKTKTVVSATRPYFTEVSRKYLPLLKPDIVLTQSEKFETFFKSHGFRVAFFPNGVDCVKFAPVSSGEKIQIRKNLGLPQDKFIVLHVGHIKPNRKLDLFMDIQQMEKIQVVVAGGTHEKSDEVLKDKLKASGIRVVHEFFEDISQLYKASDLYVFPILDLKNSFPGAYNQVGAIDLPLSVMEAMACNLPVLSTRFGALPRLFKPGSGFEYAETHSEIIQQIAAMTTVESVLTRDKIKSFDWENVIRSLETIYADILNNPGKGSWLKVSQGLLDRKGVLS